MKKNNLLKPVMVLLIAMLTFSNCEENGEIQFIVVDEFETNARIQNLQGLTVFSITNTTDISDLLDGADKFVDADIEKVTLTLVSGSHSAGIFGGAFSVNVNGEEKISFEGQLIENSPVEVTVPANVTDILSVLQGGVLPFEFSGVVLNPIADDDFTINLKFKIKAIVE